MNKNCQNCNNNFIITEDDQQFYAKIDVPIPSFCPDCRLQRRLAFRNERILYWKNCDLCKKKMVSLYHEDSPYTVYCQKCWWSDNWDPMEYGQEYDFKKPFFEQFDKLQKKVPRYNKCIITALNAEDSDFSNFILHSKSCVLSFSILSSENIFYSNQIDKSSDCFDCFNIKKCEVVYENINSENNYKTNFLLNSRNCIESCFLFNSNNCNNCFMSVNLRNKRFVIKNKQYSEKGYFNELKKLNLGSYKELLKLKRDFNNMIKKSLHKYSNIIKSYNCEGDNILNSKDLKNCFYAEDSENIKFGYRFLLLKDSMDIAFAIGNNIYETFSTGTQSSAQKFCEESADSSRVQYCQILINSSDAFGCIGLRNKQYCILNKQYTKQEYEELVPKIISHMNEMPYISS